MSLFVQGYFENDNDNGLPAAYESLQCLTSRLPRWIEDPYYDDKVSQLLLPSMSDCQWCVHCQLICDELN